MSVRFSWTEPTLCTYNHDLSKYWFVYFDFTDHLTDTTIRKQFRGGINCIKTVKERFLQGQALAAYWKNELKSGWNPFTIESQEPKIRPLIGEAFDHILKIKEVSCSRRTLHTYNHTVKLIKDWLKANRLEKMFIDQLSANHAQTFMDYLQLTKGYSGRTFNDRLTEMSTFFNCMIDREWVGTNPFRKIKKLKVEIGRNIAFTDNEKQILREYLYKNDRPLYYFTQFMYYSFIRRSELTRLRISDLIWGENPNIIIPSSSSKNKKQEAVVINEALKEMIIEMKLHRLPGEWYIFGRHLKPGPDQYVNYNHISTRHNKICKELGIDGEKGLYSWKHSGVCALYPILNGDMFSLMRQLRHTELTTTQIYLKSLGLVDNTLVRNAVW